MIFPPTLHRITILGKNADKAQTIRQLHKLGVVHVTQTPGNEQLAADTSLEGVDDISNALLTLKYIAEKTETPQNKTLTKLPTPVLAVVEARAFIDKYLEPLEQLLAEEQELLVETERAEAHLQALEQLPFDIPEHEDKHTLVYRSRKHVRLTAKGAHVAHAKSDGTHYLRVTIDEKHVEELQAAVRDTPLKRVDTSYISEGVAATRERLSNTLAAAQEELAQTRRERTSLVAHDASTLKYLITALENHYDAYTVANQFGTSKHFFVATGYCEKKDLPAIKEALPEATITAQPAENDAPTKLKNNSVAEKFQDITALFSTPKYGALDPTGFVSFFYPLFFGIMLGDIGYGLIILSLLIPLYLYLEPGKRWPVTVIGLSGLSTVFFGLVFGSFFGGLIPVTPLYKPTFEATMPLLYASLALGAVHMNLGAVLRIIQGVRRSDALRATAQALPLFVLEAAAASYVFWTPAAGHVLVALAAALLIYDQGAFGVMDITGLVGNWFSYARILALGLATSGVALAVNVIADYVHTGGIGTVLWLLILVFGHAFNLVVSTIGAGINAARLHYVEFFTLFFATGGEPFTPFKRTNYKEVNTLWSTSPADSSRSAQA